ncbi:VOC family protein [Thermaerobacter subterraneus]|uniref:Esterase n=1 Tax=Thermaerobacter subterraneus DSM 13965 TaxID=867903 RepID=K6PZY4_9FIRM|nr:VOC family protein [Thermaerobacter subterraneus]EKP94378.1 putative esterase [Thermaerobacter subterraneus DSM 13965]
MARDATVPGQERAAQVEGIHHVTMIAGDPQANADFYGGVLGMRLVKRTVNFDDPGTYHFYFGDETGRPGTLLTFFPVPGAGRGRHGAGQATLVYLSVPEGTLDYWQGRLEGFGVACHRRPGPLGRQALFFQDPDGLPLALVEEPGPGGPGWPGGPVPATAAIGAVAGVRLTVRDIEPTARILRELGYRPAGGRSGREQPGSQGTDGAPAPPAPQEPGPASPPQLWVAGPGGTGRWLELAGDARAPRGTLGAGTVHHVAFRTPTDRTQAAWQQHLARLGLHVTPVQDRQYFRSIYFREPGGVLFEIATDPPGFLIDEDRDALGTGLRLPPWYEPARAALEQALPPLHHPSGFGELGFIHRFARGTDDPDRAPVLLLLHGTGGDEHDLLPLGAHLWPGAALLSPRGQVLEDGMPRFFRRLAPGVLDAADLRRRAGDMARFVTAAARRYGFDPGRVVAVGYSNGANLAAALLLRHPRLLAGAVLFRPMAVPVEAPEAGALAGRPVLVAAGRQDPVVPPEQSLQLVRTLEAAGAAVTLHRAGTGHQLERAELDAAARWLAVEARWPWHGSGEGPAATE